MRRSLVVLSLWLMAVSRPSSAQLAAPNEERSALGAALTSDGTSVWRRAFGVSVLDGRTVAGGPDYKVEFGTDGFVLTPALGERAPVNHPFEFALDSIRRGDAVLYDAAFGPASGGGPESRGARVAYARTETIEEWYEVRREGLELGFTFAEKPEGSGDLVVRGRIATDLVCDREGESAAGFRFTCGDLGGVAIGGVKAIDALGATFSGTLRFDGVFLDLVLPGAVVERARFPLVLDPPIGALITNFGSPSDDVRRPDVAYDATNDIYLVVWQRDFSAADHDIHAQRVRGDGSFAGGLILVDNTTADDYRPAVGDANQTNRFLVSYAHVLLTSGDFSIQARAVNASDGAVSLAVLVGGTSLSPPAVPKSDVGGNASTSSDTALVVFDSGSGIDAQRMSVPASGAPSGVGGTIEVSNGSADFLPAVTKSDAATGHWLVVWNRTLTGSLDVLGRVVDANGTACAAQASIAVSSDDEVAPDCAGDGSRYMVAWQRFASASGTYDVVWRPVMHTGACGADAFSLGAKGSIHDAAGRSNESASIDYTGVEYVLAWAHQFAVGGADYDVQVAGLDALTGAICDTGQSVDGSIRRDDHPSVAAQWGGGGAGAGREALIAFDSFDAGSDDVDVRARRYVGPCVPANDDCADAIVLRNGVYAGSLVGATNDGSASCGQSASSPDVWYRYTAQCSGVLRVNTGGTHDLLSTDTGIDTVLSLHSACVGTTLNELACNDDSPSGVDPTGCVGTDSGILHDSAVSLVVTLGQEVWIRVATYNASRAGFFVLETACEPLDAACRAGNVGVDDGGAAVDVLTVNGSVGAGAGRYLVADNDAAVQVALAASSEVVPGSRYAIWVWKSRPVSDTARVLPFQIGTSCMNPLLASCGRACARYAAVSLGGHCADVLCSTPEATGNAVPGVILVIPAGTLDRGDVLFVQGVVLDRTDSSGKHLSVTNGVEVTIVD